MVRNRLLAIAVCGALALAPAVGGGCSGHEAAPAEAGAPTVKTVPITVAPVEVRPVERTVELVGTLRGWEEVTVGTKRAGRVVTVLHDIGDRVAPDEPLVELETIDADLAVEQAERQLRSELAKLGLSAMPGASFNVEAVPTVQQARVTLEQARRELGRLRNLSVRNAATLQEVQDAEDAERGAQASLENAVVTAQSTLANAQAAQVALRVAEQARADTIIRAPVPSTTPEGHESAPTYAVSGRSVSEGQMLAAGADVMDLVIEDPLKLEGTVPERFVAEVALGQPVRIRVAAHEAPFDGTITRINPAVDPVSRTFGIEATVPNREGRLRPGSFAKASIITRRDDAATIVPMEAIVSFAGVTKVFVHAGDTAREVQVQTRLEDPDGRWIEVVGDLRPGDQVVTTGMSQLADGTRTVLREAPAPGAAGPPGPTEEPPTPAATPEPAPAPQIQEAQERP